MPRTAYARKNVANTKPASAGDAVKMRAIRRAAMNSGWSEYALANEFGVSPYCVRMCIEGVGMPMEWCDECGAECVMPCVACNSEAWKRERKNQQS